MSPFLRRGLLASAVAVLAVAGAVPGMRSARAQTSDATTMYPQEGFSEVSGAVVYASICQGCHMPQGQGARGAGEYPALANNPKVAAAPYVAMMVLEGRGGMPPLGGMLNDRQVAEVVQYVRTHFGNAYEDPFTADDAKAMRR